MCKWYYTAHVFWFILLSVIYSRSSHVVTTGRISSFLTTKLFCMCTTCVFFHASVDGHLSCFHFWPMWICTPIFAEALFTGCAFEGMLQQPQSILPWTNGKKRGSWPSTERDSNTIRNLFSFFFFCVSFLPCPNFIVETTCVEPTLQFSSEVQKWLHGSSMSFQILIPWCVKSPRKLEENAFLPEQGQEGCRLKDIPMFYSWKDVGGLGVLIITIIIFFIFTFRCREWS